MTDSKNDGSNYNVYDANEKHYKECSRIAFEVIAETYEDEIEYQHETCKMYQNTKQYIQFAYPEYLIDAAKKEGKSKAAHRLRKK